MTHARNTLRNAMTCRQDEPKLSRKTHLLGGDNERPCAVPQVRSEVSSARSERSGQTFPLARRGAKMGTRGRSGNRFSLRSTQCRANDRCNRANHHKIQCTLLRAALPTIHWSTWLSRDHTHLDEPAYLLDQYRGEVEAAASAKYDKGHERGQAVIVPLNDL